MASTTKKLKVRRALRSAAAARARKNEIRRHGSTPPCLPLNAPNANELKMKAAAKA